jgi:hypothetical protein
VTSLQLRTGRLHAFLQVKTRDFSGMACNLDGLLDEIASACRAVFTPAAEAVSRSAVVITPLATPLPVSAQVAVVGRERSIAAVSWW